MLDEIVLSGHFHRMELILFTFYRIYEYTHTQFIRTKRDEHK